MSVTISKVDCTTVKSRHSNRSCPNVIPADVPRFHCSTTKVKRPRTSAVLPDLLEVGGVVVVEEAVAPEVAILAGAEPGLRTLQASFVFLRDKRKKEIRYSRTQLIRSGLLRSPSWTVLLYCTTAT